MLLQFTKAVEAKQVAQQDAERARFVVMKADQVIGWQAATAATAAAVRLPAASLVCLQ